jgi:uncharacterized protein (DUF362 family)/NAD-dependent dihydropyrimidine dehydrogenase PreA subunit
MNSEVSVVECESYGVDPVRRAVSESLSLLGGMERFVKGGDRVLLKVNLLSASSPEQAITTHPTVVKAVVEEVLRCGGVPLIADSPGGPYDENSLKKAYKRSGLDGVAEETGVSLNLDTGSCVASYPSGKILKRLDVIRVLNDVDVVITLPKMKTHVLMQFTGATKILFGVVPGVTKAVYHMKFQDKEMFADMLLDILGYVKPSLSIMDGVMGLEGDGPGASGTPKHVGVILASPDSVALDLVATSIIGMEPQDVPPLRRAIARGLTSGKLSDVNVLGSPVDSVRVAFKKPRAASGVSAKVLSSPIIRSIFMSLLAPYPVANSSCVRCGVCKRNCPTAAITVSDKAYMDLGKCIRCYCCHELCPHKAIDLKKGFLSRVLFK